MSRTKLFFAGLGTCSLALVCTSQSRSLVTLAEAQEATNGPGCLAGACAEPLPESAPDERNVLGGELATCSTDPMTGFFRDGTCRIGPNDRGVHVVCATVTQEFLDYTAERGNDLQTPAPQYRFPGLHPGDNWCLCAARWDEARRDGVAPPVVIEATHASALEVVDLSQLETHQ